MPSDEPATVMSHDPALFLDTPPRARGHDREDGKDLYVTAGLGTGILPVRFDIRPEIAILTVRATAPKRDG